MLEERSKNMRLSYKKVAIGMILVGLVTWTMEGCSKVRTNSANLIHSKSCNLQNHTQIKDLEIWWWGNQTRNKITQQVLKMYSQKHSEVDFSVQFSVWSDYWNKLSASAAGHTLPDIVQMDYRYLSQYVEHDLLVDLTPYIESGMLKCNDLREEIKETGKINDKTYAVVCGVNAPALLYNKTLLEENNIAIHDYMSLEEFIQIARMVYEKTGYKTNIAYSNEELVSEYMLRDEGYVFYGQEGNTIRSAKDIEPFFSLYEQGRKEGWLIETRVFADRTIGSIEQDPLVYGTTPDTLSWCSFVYSNQSVAYQDAAPSDVEIGITTCPANHPEKANFLKPSTFWAITTDCDNIEAAVNVINYMLNDVECNSILLGERGIPASVSVSEAISSNLGYVDQKVVDYINNVIIPKSSKLNPPPVKNNDVVIGEIKCLIQEVSNGMTTTEQAANKLYETVKKLYLEE